MALNDKVQFIITENYKMRNVSIYMYVCKYFFKGGDSLF